MTFRMVLNNFERGIKHTVCLTVPRFLIEDAPFRDVTCELPVATVIIFLSLTHMRLPLSHIDD